MSISVHALALYGIGYGSSAMTGTVPRPSQLQVRLAPVANAEAPRARPPRQAAGAHPSLFSQAAQAGRPATDALADILPAPHYYRAGELDSRPAPLGTVEPKPPRDMSASARVIARILINERGEADRVIIVRGAPNDGFDSAVVEAFGATRYRPGIKGGIPVKSQIVVEVSFDTGSGPEPRP